MSRRRKRGHGSSIVLFTSGGGAGLTDPDAIALVARMTPTPSNARQLLIQALIVSLKTGATSGTNIWTKLDLFWVLAADAEANALLEWKGNVLYNGVKVGTPTFTIDRGFVSSAVGNYIATTYEPFTVPLTQTQNSAHMGVYLTAGAATSTTDMAYGNNSNRIGSNLGALNDSAAGVQAPPTTTIPGHFCAIRTGAAIFTTYRNGIAGTNNANASTSNGSGTPLTLLALSAVSAGSSRTVAICHTGVGLSTAEDFDMYTACNTFLTAIGSPA